jgi:hypothetical protein
MSDQRRYRRQEFDAMMDSLRNVQDAAPAGYDFARASRLAMRVASGIGHRLGEPVLPLFERFGGGHLYVTSTFGRQGDCVLVKPGPQLFAETSHWPETDVADLNEALAEAIGHLFLHYPVARAVHGDDVVLGIPRFSRTREQGEVRGEATAFMIGFLMPQPATVAAFDAGLDDHSIAARFGVTLRLVQARGHALKRHLAAA